eukprot:snap_masked-scaffold_1-processed-gene-24.41-mRNA-1 protein AED:1.00 eAED:1.00 QI:0/0/0/0/1/1/3/0/472
MTPLDNEETPLIRVSISPKESFIERKTTESKSAIRVFWNHPEFIGFSCIAFPVTIFSFLQEFQTLVSIVAVSRFYTEPEYLASLNITFLIGNLFGSSVIYGFLSGYDTVAANLFGMRQLIELQATTLLSVVSCFFLVALFYLLSLGIPHVLTHFIREKEVIELVDSLLRLYTPLLLLRVIDENIKHCYQAQNTILRFLISNSIAAFLHPFFVVQFLGWFGFRGIMLAHIATQSTQTLITTFLALKTGCKKFSLSQSTNTQLQFVLLNWKPFLALCFSGILSMSEWWYWETIALLVSTLGKQEMAAQSVAYVLIPFLYMIPNGIGTAAQIRIAFWLGDDRPEKARDVAFWAAGVTCVLGMCSSLFSFGFQMMWISLFQVNERNEHIVKQYWKDLCFFLFLNCIQGSFIGILKGYSKHSQVFNANLICLWSLGAVLTVTFEAFGVFDLTKIWLILNSTYFVFDAYLLHKIVSVV